MVRVSKNGNVYLYTYVKKSQRLAFEKIAKKKGTTLSALMRMVLEEYLENQAKKAS